MLGVGLCLIGANGGGCASPADHDVTDGGVFADAINVDAPLLDRDVISDDASLADASAADGAVDPYAAACEGFDYQGVLVPGVTARGDLQAGRVSKAKCGVTGFLWGRYAAEQMWALRVDAPATVTLHLAGVTNFPAVLYARADSCDHISAETTCAYDTKGAGGPRQVDHMFFVYEPTTYYVIVDGLAGATGHYELNADVQPFVPVGGNCVERGDEPVASDRCVSDATCEPTSCSGAARCVPAVDEFAGELRCGDGVVEFPEDCDGGEGCSADCHSLISYCDDVSPLPFDTWVSGAFSTDDTSHTRGNEDGLGPERIFHVDVPEHSFARVFVEGASGYFRRECADTGSEFARLIDGTADIGTSADIVVEGCGAGSFRVRAELHSLRVVGETCDVTGDDPMANCERFCVDKAPAPTCQEEWPNPAACMPTTGLPTLPTGLTLGTTTGRANDNDLASCGGATSGDISYRLVLPSISHVRIWVEGVGSTPLLHPLISFLGDCDEPLRSRSCRGDSWDDEQIAISAEHMPAGNYRVSVDGVGGSEGDFALHVEVLPDIADGANCDVIWRERALPWGGTPGVPQCVGDDMCLEGPAGWVCTVPCLLFC